MKKFYIFLLTLIFVLTGCTTTKEQDDIIILFTSDVHCAVNSNIGYSGIAAYKKSIESNNEHVTLVDLGDAIQGQLIGSVSKGEYIIDIMNYLEYDIATLGNHEFDYGMDQLAHLIDTFNGKYVGCNIDYTGKNQNKLENLQPFEIIKYGDVEVAYIGVTTPYTVSSTTPTFFIEDDEYVYDFYSGENGQRLINKVQTTINECRSMGADYIIGLTHLGSTEDDSPYSSKELIQGTTGFTAVLDGHAHVKISSDIVQDINGNDVLLGSVGTEMDAIGQLTITSNGNITLTHIDNYEKQDLETTNFIKSKLASFEKDFNTPFVTTNKKLSIYDENGIRIVRTRETGIGNLIADAYRYLGNTDIGFVQTGGIRADINEGDITYADVHKIHPYGNYLVTVEATGQEILDTLEISVQKVASEYQIDGVAYGENGSFLSVSGLKYDVDTTIPSPVILDENENLVKIEGPRKISNVKILQNGEYVDIDPNATYTVSSNDYIIKHGGCSNNLFMDNKIIINEGPYDYLVVVEYLKHLNGNLTQYSNIEGRMNIIK